MEKRGYITVLILVVMDDALALLDEEDSWLGCIGLNPCCNG